MSCSISRLPSSPLFALSLNELLRRSEMDWHGIQLGQPDWSDDSHSIACTIRVGPGHLPFWLHLMFNAYWEPLDLDLPTVPATAVSGWQRWIDTARESPEDIVDIPAAPPVTGIQYPVMPRSAVVLFVRIDARSDPASEVEDNVAEAARTQRVMRPESGAQST